MWAAVPIMATADGPSEVHKITAAREVLKDYQPSPGMWPTGFLPDRREEARAKLAARLEHSIANS
jgi:acyl-CoA dehydrogenase